MDRGRTSDNIRQAKALEEWEKIISKSGLKIKQHKRHLSKTIIQIWDIGLRPLFPLPYKMVANILEIKKEWIEAFKMFLEPIYKMDHDLNKTKDLLFTVLF